LSEDVQALQLLREEDLFRVEQIGESNSDEDVVEVGRGIANYNSAQIARVKGLHRCG
jgi:glutamate 5-kinase